MKKLILAVIMMSGAAAPVLAQQSTFGPYVGAAAGQFNLHIDNLNDLGTGVGTIAHSNTDAWKVFAGWRFFPFLAVDAAYVDFGHVHNAFTTSGSSGVYHSHMDGFSPSAVVSWPLGIFEVFGRVGYLFYNEDLSANVSSLSAASVSSSHSRTDWLYGGGVGVTLIDHLNVRAEFNQVNFENAKDSNTLWLEAAWLF